MILAQFDDYAQQARDQLEAEEPRQAALLLALGAQADGLLHDDQRLNTLFRLVGDLGRAVDARPLADAAEAALRMDPDALYELGYQLVEVGLPRVAVPVLQRLDHLQPGQARVVQELAAAFEQAGQHAMARDLLLENPALLDAFWPRYLLCFHALSSGDLDTARAFVSDLVATSPDEQVPTSRIRGMIDRADAISGSRALALNDLRAWHFVMNGSVLLHLSPYGFDDGMHGRYAYLNDQVTEIRAQIERLAAALVATDQVPDVVRACDDQGSRIVATALAERLGCAPSLSEVEGPGLVVAYDLGLHTPQTLPSVAPEALLFARAANWTNPPARVPHYLGLMHQYLVAPWAADDAPDLAEEAWVASILDAEVPAPEHPDLDPMSAVLALAEHRGQPTDRWFDGPVMSGRFH